MILLLPFSLLATFAIVLAGCSTTARAPVVNVVPAPARELTAAEKAALAPQIAASLKDPSAAQFKWLPVFERERDGITDYCGLLNGKNSYGGYTGFTRFYVHLTKDSKGQFVKAVPRGFEPTGDGVNIFESTAFGPGVCESFGYTDFSKAR